MSMKHTKGRQSKGKQKIEIKKVETYADRMITFSKRKSGIFKKMNEIITLCDAEATFLVFTHAGKPYTFASPSMEEAAGRLKNHMRDEPSAKDGSNTGPIVEAYKKKRIEDLMKNYLELVDELDMVKEKEKRLKKSSDEKKLDQMWWNVPVEGVEELKRRYQAFVELHVGLRSVRFGKDGDASSSGGAGHGHCGRDEAEA